MYLPNNAGTEEITIPTAWEIIQIGPSQMPWYQFVDIM